MKNILPFLVMLLALSSCGGGKEGPGVKSGFVEIAVDTIIVGIGPIPNVASLESYTIFGAVSSGIIFEYKNGSGKYKVDMDSVGEAAFLSDSSPDNMKKLSNNTLACVYRYQGKILVPAISYKQAVTETELTNKQAEFLPRLVNQAMQKVFPSSGGPFTGRMYLKNLSYENRPGQKVLFRGEWLIFEGRP